MERVMCPGCGEYPTGGDYCAECEQAYKNWPAMPDVSLLHSERSPRWDGRPIYDRWYWRTDAENPTYWGPRPDGTYRWMAGDEPSPFTNIALFWSVRHKGGYFPGDVYRKAKVNRAYRKKIEALESEMEGEDFRHVAKSLLEDKAILWGCLSKVHFQLMHQVEHLTPEQFTRVVAYWGIGHGFDEGWSDREKELGNALAEMSWVVQNRVAPPGQPPYEVGE